MVELLVFCVVIGGIGLLLLQAQLQLKLFLICTLQIVEKEKKNQIGDQQYYDRYDRHIRVV